MLQISNFQIVYNSDVYHFVYLFTVNVSGTMHLIGHSVKIDEQRHIKITDLRLKEQQIGDMKIFATNLINGNPELSKSQFFFFYFGKLFFYSRKLKYII